MKWQVDKMASRQTGKQTKWQVDKMASRQNGKQTKWPSTASVISFKSFELGENLLLAEG